MHLIHLYLQQCPQSQSQSLIITKDRVATYNKWPSSNKFVLYSALEYGNI